MSPQLPPNWLCIKQIFEGCGILGMSCIATFYLSFTFSDQLFHRDLVSTDGEHLSNIVAAARSRPRATAETSALRLWHTRELLHSRLCVPAFPKWTIETVPSSRNRLKLQSAHHRFLVQHAESSVLLRCAWHFRARGSQKGVAERFLHPSKPSEATA